MSHRLYEPWIEAQGQDRVRVGIDSEGEPIRYLEALDLWEHDAAFRSVFVSILAGVRYRAFRWETPPLAAGSGDRDFEFVILDAAELDGPADPAAFADHFRSPSASDGVVAFPNLGGDALLIVPEPQGPEDAYAHLAAFARRGPQAQNHALWRAVGRAMKRRLGPAPIWLSTAGGGVPWLHVRLDTLPKYYCHRPYAAERVVRDGR